MPTKRFTCYWCLYALANPLYFTYCSATSKPYFYLLLTSIFSCQSLLFYPLMTLFSYQPPSFIWFWQLYFHAIHLCCSCCCFLHFPIRDTFTMSCAVISHSYSTCCSPLYFLDSHSYSTCNLQLSVFSTSHFHFTCCYYIFHSDTHVSRCWLLMTIFSDIALSVSVTFSSQPLLYCPSYAVHIFNQLPQFSVRFDIFQPSQTSQPAIFST